MKRAQGHPRRKPASAPLDPVFNTDRLAVFKYVVRRQVAAMRGVLPRVVYQGWHRLQDIPYPIVTITIWPGSPLGHWVEWIETAANRRCNGFAAELWNGVEGHLGARLTPSEPVTPDGMAFAHNLGIVRYNDA